MNSEGTWREQGEKQSTPAGQDFAWQDGDEWSCDGVPAELPSWDDLPEPDEEPLVRFPGLRAPTDAPIFF
ncbi:MAG: hypothetical protein Kow00109_13670 [Acidobacteriota bacterium]